MTYTITNQCISCQRCLSACPTGAVQTAESTFWIDVNRCDQCASSHGVPQCWAVCPTNQGCIPLTSGAAAVSLTAGAASSTDYWESWFVKYAQMVARLEGALQSSYWQQWFDAYSRRLQALQTACAGEV